MNERMKEKPINMACVSACKEPLNAKRWYISVLWNLIHMHLDNKLHYIGNSLTSSQKHRPNHNQPNNLMLHNIHTTTTAHNTYGL